jgi:hypothetical protein
MSREVVLKNLYPSPPKRVIQPYTEADKTIHALRTENNQLAKHVHILQDAARARDNLHVQLRQEITALKNTVANLNLELLQTSLTNVSFNEGHEALSWEDSGRVELITDSPVNAFFNAAAVWDVPAATVETWDVPAATVETWDVPAATVVEIPQEKLPEESTNYRVVTLSGTPEADATALYLLSQKIYGMTEKELIKLPADTLAEYLAQFKHAALKPKSEAAKKLRSLASAQLIADTKPE